MMIRVLKITTHSSFFRFCQFGMDIYDVFVIKSLKEENLGTVVIRHSGYF